jgi:hypothetical protein
MPLDHKRFVRRRPADPVPPRETRLIQKAPFDITGQLSAKDLSGSSTALSLSDKTYEGQLMTDLRTQDLLRDVLYELKHIRLHLEAMSGENLRGDVDYADQ